MILDFLEQDLDFLKCYNKLAFDLILFVSGIGVSLIMLLTMQLSSLQGALFSLAPALICGFLVIPIPNYHNVLCLIIDIYYFFSNQRKFEWKGWCFKDGSNKNKR